MAPLAFGLVLLLGIAAPAHSTAGLRFTDPLGQLRGLHEMAQSGRAGSRSELTLMGTNGYRITIRGSENGVLLAASRRHEGAIYFASKGRAIGGDITAEFENLGAVSVHFRPSGRVRERKVPRGCTGRPARVFDELGAFVGTIRFRGELGYTQVRASHARGRIGPPQQHICRSGSENSAASGFSNWGPRSKRPLFEFLSGALGGPTRIFRAGRSALTQAAKFKILPLRIGELPHRGVPYSVVSLDTSRAVSTVRVLVAKGPSSSFTFNDQLTTASLSPPPPFAGSVSLHLCPMEALRSSLSVALPGQELRFRRQDGLRSLAKLRPRGSCLA
jgi:hypothetical protein